MSKRAPDCSLAPATVKQQKRRKTNRDPDAGVPVIKGCPAHLVPLLLEAVKARRKYLSLSKAEGSSRTEDTMASSAPERNTFRTSTVKDRLLMRLMRNSENKESGDHAVIRKAAEEAEVACGGFLRALRSEESANGRRPPHQRSTVGEEVEKSVSVSCLTFLMDLLYGLSTKLTTRRASLQLTGELLRRSSNCRECFTKAECIRRFLNFVGNVSNEKCSGDRRNFTAESIQRDSLVLLDGLSIKFGEFYPRLAVAARYLKERTGVVMCHKPADMDEEITGSVGMVNLRRIRNIALQCGERECTRVRRILDRADGCFEVLVPCFQQENRPGLVAALGEKESVTVGTECGNKSDLATWSDDDVDWEEGEGIADSASCSDGADSNISDLARAATAVDHEQAVDRTMVMMRSAGVMGDGLEINFDSDRKEEELFVGAMHNDGGTSRSAAEDSARATLQKCVESLSHHFTRLGHWVDSLVSADNMVDQERSQNDSLASNAFTASSLVLMPAALRQKRSQLLRSLVNLKSEVSRCLAAASKLSIFPERQKPSSAIQGAARQTVPQRASVHENSRSASSPNGPEVAMSSSLLRSALGIKRQDRESIRSRLLSKHKVRPTNGVVAKRTSRVQIKIRKT